MAEPTKKNNDLKKEIEKTAKLFDVAKPGKTPPSSSSRPTIVGHSPMIKRDPMVKDSGSEAATEGPAPEEPEEKLAPHVAKKIVPLGEKPEEDKAAAETETEEPSELKIEVRRDDKPAEEPAVDTSELPKSVKRDDVTPAENEPAKEEEPEEEPEETEEEPAAEPTKEPDPEKEPESEEPVEKDPTGAAVDVLAGEVSAKREEQKQKEELEAKKAEVEAHIAKKEFFVPIGQESRRRLNVNILIGLVVIIILTLAAMNFAADAELLDVGIKPFTDIM